VKYAIVSVAGLIAGCAEFYLLPRYIKALLSGNIRSSFLLILGKLLILAVLLLPTVIFAPDVLWLAGCAVIVPLIAGGGRVGYKIISGKKEAQR
jgi:hypothetical protein